MEGKYNSTPRLNYPRYRLTRRLGGPQRRSDALQKIKICYMLGNAYNLMIVIPPAATLNRARTLRWVTTWLKITFLWLDTPARHVSDNPLSTTASHHGVTCGWYKCYAQLVLPKRERCYMRMLQMLRTSVKCLLSAGVLGYWLSCRCFRLLAICRCYRLLTSVMYYCGTVMLSL